MGDRGVARWTTVLVRLIAAVGLLAVVGCSARGVNGETSDDRAAAELRTAATGMLAAGFRFHGTETTSHGDLPPVSGRFQPPDQATLDAPAPGALALAARPQLLLAATKDVKYTTRSAGALRFNLPGSALDSLVGGTASEDDDFTGEAFVSNGRIDRIRFQATRQATQYGGDLLFDAP